MAPVAPLTDLGNAERFARQHGASVRYVVPWRSWLVWDGTRWKRDELRAVEQRAKETVRSIWAEAAAGADKEERVSIAKWAERSEGIGRVRALLELAEAEKGIPTSAGAFDRHPFLLNVANGTLDLRTAQLATHRPDDLLTKSTWVRYEPDTPCPRWTAFLHRIFDKDVALIAYLQRAIGYTLTGDTREQCLHVLHGSGQNGKSTFLEVLASVLGDYAIQADFATFLDKANDAGPRNGLARLAGSRFVRSSEVGEGKRLNETLIKHLTGSEVISASFLYAESFEFEPTFKIWLAANHKPVIRGGDLAIWRRLRLVPFNVTIPAHEKDDTLKAALLDEAPGILAWAVAGCLEWQEIRLQPPEVVSIATQEYRQESDVIGAFLDDCCEQGEKFEVPATDLYASYRRWAELGGEYILSQTAFGRKIDERGFESRKNGFKYRCGLKLRLESSNGQFGQSRTVKTKLSAPLNLYDN